MHACMCVHQANSVVPDSMDYSPPDSSIHRNLQARILEWVAMPSFRVSSRPRGLNPSLLWLLHCRQPTKY